MATCRPSSAVANGTSRSRARTEYSDTTVSIAERVQSQPARLPGPPVQLGGIDVTYPEALPDPSTESGGGSSGGVAPAGFAESSSPSRVDTATRHRARPSPGFDVDYLGRHQSRVTNARHAGHEVVRYPMIHVTYRSFRCPSS